MCDDSFAWLVYSAKHTHNQLVLKADICVQEEVVELSFEILEQGIWDLILDTRRQLIIESEFFNDQIEIENERILNELFDWMI